ncbi:MAG: helix-turn-helix domain-containing protein, partial [Candidatus Thorarchaeota archaeon]
MTPEEGNPEFPPASAEQENAAQCAIPMEIPVELLTVLQSRFKLSESQSRVYTVLLVMGQLTADEVSNYSGIPMVKARSTIESLEKQQLIKALPGVVSRYRAFAPYKELAEEVQAFTKDTQKSWKELQQLQTKTLGEIHDELQLMIRQTRNALENLNERQGIALNEAAMATNIVLSNVAENLQKALSEVASSSVNEISDQIKSVQAALSNLIDEGVTQLDETQKQVLDDTIKAING